MTVVETAIGTAKTMVLNMGPQHPSTHGVLRILLELDGETVVKATPDLGYLHTGIEKSCEDKTYSQAITLTDRMDYLNPLGNNLVYCLAAEKLLGIEVPAFARGGTERQVTLSDYLSVVEPLEHDRCVGAAESERVRQHAGQRHIVATFAHDRHVRESRIEGLDIGTFADESVVHHQQ